MPTKRKPKAKTKQDSHETPQFIVDMAKLTDKIFKDGETDNYELAAACEALKIPLVGVCFVEDLKNIKPEIGAYVINLGHGTHWVGLLNMGDDGGKYYFDSYGIGPPKAVADFVGEKNLFYNHSQIQANNSNYCGQYVLYFLYCMTTFAFEEYPDGVDGREVFNDFINQFHVIRKN